MRKVRWERSNSNDLLLQGGQAEIEDHVHLRNLPTRFKLLKQRDFAGNDTKNKEKKTCLFSILIINKFFLTVIHEATKTFLRWNMILKMWRFHCFINFFNAEHISRLSLKTWHYQLTSIRCIASYILWKSNFTIKIWRAIILLSILLHKSYVQNLCTISDGCLKQYNSTQLCSGCLAMAEQCIFHSQCWQSLQLRLKKKKFLYLHLKHTEGESYFEVVKRFLLTSMSVRK